MKHSKLIELLRDLQDRYMVFEPLGGNNGDRLIELGARYLMERERVKLSNEVQSDSVIVINGSGDLTYHPSEKPIEETRQWQIFTTYPNNVVILLPSSTTNLNVSMISTAINARSAKTILFARDSLSYSFLLSLKSDLVEVHLDHDMAFALYNTSWLNEVKSYSNEDNLLIVERFDSERASEPSGSHLVAKRIAKVFPDSFKNFVKQRVLRKFYEDTVFVGQSKNKVAEVFPLEAYSKVVSADISLPKNYNFDEFVMQVASAGIVVSTRLHV